MTDGVSSSGLREGFCKEMGEWDYQGEGRGKWNIYIGSEWETYQEDDASHCTGCERNMKDRVSIGGVMGGGIWGPVGGMGLHMIVVIVDLSGGQCIVLYWLREEYDR